MRNKEDGKSSFFVCLFFVFLTQPNHKTTGNREIGPRVNMKFRGCQK